MRSNVTVQTVNGPSARGRSDAQSLSKRRARVDLPDAGMPQRTSRRAVAGVGGAAEDIRDRTCVAERCKHHWRG